MPTGYYSYSDFVSDNHDFVVGGSEDSIGWISYELDPEIDIQIKKDIECCWLCGKKHGKRTYEVETAFSGKKKVCSNCKFVYDILRREIIDNDNGVAISYIHSTLTSIKTTMELKGES